MTPDFLAAMLFAGALLATWAATGAILPFLRRRRVLDHPNERSSHAVATPRGGGIALVGVIVGAWSLLHVFGAQTIAGFWWLIAGTGLLAAVSWVDDLRGLSPLPRLAAQTIAVVAGTVVVEGVGPVFQGLLPPLADGILVALCWLWFVNLFNFMDGIDGLSGAQAACIGLGLYLLARAGGTETAGLPALALAGAALGFLRWNWHPARIFLGDVGSVPLGFLLGWLLLALAAAGQWQAASILPLYYLADASLTLALRAWRGERVWRAHRQHFYQRAVLAGASHAAVVRAIVSANLVLVALAVVAPGAAWPLAAAAIVVAALLAYLTRIGRR